MKLWLCLAMIIAFIPASFAVVRKKASPPKVTARKKAASGKAHARFAPKHVPTRQAKQSRNSKSSKSRQPLVARQSQPARQLAPSNERYKEIQEALATKGYLITPPNGLWDQDSQDAMRRFQADQKISSSGKLTSKSIIALGLGPSKP